MTVQIRILCSHIQDRDSFFFTDPGDTDCILLAEISADFIINLQKCFCIHWILSQFYDIDDIQYGTV